MALRLFVAAVLAGLVLWPVRADVVVRCRMGGRYGRGDWITRCETDSRMTCDAGQFHVVSELRAWEGDELVFEHTWRSDIPRDLV